MNESDTRGKLLDTAMELVQTRGYNAFSFHDLAHRVGIKTASIHYHFPTKGDLGVALVKRHRQFLGEVLNRLDKVQDVPERLRLYAGVFRSTLENHYRMCLCGILAIEYQTLPDPLVAEIQAFFEDNERWLGTVLEAGSSAGVMVLARPALEVARTLFAALEGILLSARLFGDLGRFDTTAAVLLSQLTS